MSIPNRANYVLIESDLALDPSNSSVMGDAAFTTRSNMPGQQELVRRPTRGIQLKKETFATMSVTADVALKNSSAPDNTEVNFTSNFLLQSVQEQRTEKFQAITTFGAAFGFFFGEQPRMVSFSAILLNTADFQWEAEWWENYDQYLRGTRLVDRGARVVLTYEDVVLEGYLVQAATQKGEPNIWAVGLSFTMWVTNVAYLIDVGAPRVDELHQSEIYLNPNELDEGGPTLLEQVRARNVAALANSGTGLVSAIRTALDTLSGYTGQVGQAINNSVDWLYGRNLVIPAGFAGSELVSGQAIFAEGDRVQLPESLAARIPGRVGALNLTSPVLVMSRSRASFHEANPDEYPARQVSRPLATPEPRDESPDPSIAFAEKMFRSFGIAVTTAEEGVRTSSVVRTINRVRFGAISYGASATSSDAAALRGGSAGGIVAAAVSQAALEGML